MSARQWRPEHRRPPVAAMTARALRRELVTDAVRGHATELRRFTEAVIRIAQRTGRPAEAVFRDLEDEVVAKTGRPLPIG